MMKKNHAQLKINPQEHITIQLEEALLLDRLHTLSTEYCICGSTGQSSHKETP